VALVTDIQNKFITTLEEYRDFDYANNFIGDIETDDPEAISEDESPRLVCVLYEDAIIDESLGTSFRLLVRLGIKIYVFDAQSGDTPAENRAQSVEAKALLADRTEKLRKTLMKHRTVGGNGGWRDMRFSDPLSSYHRSQNTRWSTTVIELVTTDRV
jgi:hypothetical protein